MNWNLHTFFENIWLSNVETLKIISTFSDTLALQEQVKWSIFKFLESNEKVNDEIERTFLRIDKDVLIDMLEKHWAEKMYEWNMEDNKYDFKDNWLKEDWWILRIRELQNWKFDFTLKKRDDDSLVDTTLAKNREFEESYDSEEITNIIKNISSLWFEILENKNVKRYRISYKVWPVHFDIDKYEWLSYWLLEIESNKEEDIAFWKEKLWLEWYETVNYWYRKLRELEENEKRAI
jgi:adenylate cyclase class IV